MLALAGLAGPAVAQPTSPSDPVAPPPSDPVAPPPIDPVAPPPPIDPVAPPPPIDPVPPPPSDPVAPPPIDLVKPPIAPPAPPPRSIGAVVGIEVGVGTVAGDEGVYGVGVGKAFTLGYRVDAWTFEARFAESYDLGATVGRLADAGVRGPLSATSAGVRRVFGGGPLLPEAFVGVARVERPIFVDAATLRQFGVGVVLGAAVALPIGGGFLLAAEGRAGLVRWDNPPAPIATDPMDDGTTVTFTPSVESAQAIPLTLSLAVRVLF